MKFYHLLGFAVSFSLLSCDDNKEVERNEAVTPPTDLTPVSNANNSNPTNDGANVALQSRYQTEVFNLINAERAKRNLDPLVIDARLTELANQHNESMIQVARAANTTEILISHDNFDNRAQTMFGFNYKNVGENVAGNRGFETDVVTSTFVNGWSNSPGHFRNIIDDYTHTGVGVRVDEQDGTVYATQLFAR